MKNSLQRPHSIFANLLICGGITGLLLCLPTIAIGQDDPTSLRRELDRERQRLAEQMRQLEAQMSAFKQQQERLDDMERRLDAADSTASNRLAEPKAEPVRDEADEQVAATVVQNQQLLAGEGRSDPYTDERFTKSTPLFGSPWRFSFGGYAKLDVLHDFSGTGNEQEFVLSTIPVDGSPQPGSYTQTQISETRFHFESRNLDPAYASNRLYLEFDFFDEQNQTSTRLRHAYAQYGKLLVGRTWTLLTELRQLPLLLDFAAGDSILGGRTEQIRWTTTAASQTFGWSVALEQFNDGAILNPEGAVGEARSDYPRLTAGFTKLWDRLVWSAGGAVTQLRFDGGDGTKDATDLAFTVTTAGRFYLDSGKQNWLGYGLGYQSGSVTDVITFANGRVPNAAIDRYGNLDLAKSWNTQIGLHWNWNADFSSNFSYAYARLTEVPRLFEQYDPDLIRTGSSYHVNLIYTYNPLLSGGLEFMYGNRENVSGRDGDAQRLQFSLFYYY